MNREELGRTFSIHPMQQINDPHYVGMSDYLSKEDMEKDNEVYTPWGIFHRRQQTFKAT